MLERLLFPEFKLALQERDWESIVEICAMIHAPVVAEMLDQCDDPEAVVDVMTHLDPSAQAQLFPYLDEEDQDRLVERMPKSDLAKLLERMSHDDRADLVKRMDDDRQAVVMPLVARAEREDIIRLARYEEGTAGSIMTTDYARLTSDLTVEQALAKLRREAPDRETIYYIYVTDSDRRLIGFISLKDLILATPKKTVGEVMQTDVLYVTVDMDVEEAANRLAEYDLIAIPVVDNDYRLVGIITHDDVIDVLMEEATEDAHLMGAMQPLEREYIESPFWHTVGKRVPWLAVLLGFEMIASFVLMLHEELLAVWTAMMVFLPVIIATGGNTGSQAASMITRSLALGEVEPRDVFRVARRELFSGLAMGMLLGTLGAIVVAFIYREPRIALVLIFGLTAVTTFGSLLGALLPLGFKWVGLDPATSSTPLVASAVDVLGILVYCLIAGRLLAMPENPPVPAKPATTNIRPNNAAASHLDRPIDAFDNSVFSRNGERDENCVYHWRDLGVDVLQWGVG